jgi:putative CocE/NonD family hydrolase
MFREGLAWFHAHLRDQPLPRPAPVKLFIMGANEWREFAQWPPPHGIQSFYLRENGTLSRTPATTPFAAAAFIYDPADPTPSLGGAVFDMNSAGPVDNRPLAARRDLLRFSSAPLSAPLTVIGHVQATLFVQTNAPQADFFARLCVGKADGKLLNLCEGIARLQITAAETHEITVDMWATAVRFAPGERIVLLIAGGAHPRWARNPGFPASPGENKTGRPVLQTVFHDRTGSSTLILPVVADKG